MKKGLKNLNSLGEFSRLLLTEKDYIKIYTNNRKTSNVKSPRILRILCQRPFFTGSGINFVNLIRKTKELGFDQFLIFGTPAGIDNPLKGIISSDRISPVIFRNPEEIELHSDVSFAVAGMSDKMPYFSTTFSSFSHEMLEEYLTAFAKKIEDVVQKFKPNIIHSHHLWLITALSRVLNPQLPIIATCHNTALRQMSLASHLQSFITTPIKNIDYIAVNNETQMKRVEEIYNFGENDRGLEKFFYIGQGINTRVFYTNEKVEKSKDDSIKRIIYTGKLAFSKGVPQLIEAFKQLCSELDKNYELYIVGSGVGEEKDKIINYAKESENIHFLGQIEQSNLADKFRECDLFVLPSFYDGFPKVMLEALSCGCKVIITDIPGIKENLQNIEGYSENIHFIPLPRMKTIDEPIEEDLPDFIQNLKNEMKYLFFNVCLKNKDIDFCNKIRRRFGSKTLFKKYLDKYNEIINH